MRENDARSALDEALSTIVDLKKNIGMLTLGYAQACNERDEAYKSAEAWRRDYETACAKRDKAEAEVKIRNGRIRRAIGELNGLPE